MDRFMIQNMMRCVMVPFQKYHHDPKDKIEFSYFLHTYFCPDILSFLGLMKQSFPLTSMTVHDRQVVLRERHPTSDPYLFLQQYSLHRVKKKWKSVENLDMVIFIRLDLLFTKALSASDIDLMCQRKHNFIFIAQGGGDHKPFVAMGDPMVMNLFADYLYPHHLPTHEQEGEQSFLDMMRVQHSIHSHYISLVYIRIMPGGAVCPDDSRVCPYLGDLIASSPTQIRLTKRKNTLTPSPQTVLHEPVQYQSGHVSGTGISS